jgi:glucan 1,3-beta-glucosidase
LSAEIAMPRFARIFATERPRDPLTLSFGAILIVLAVLAIQTALGLLFDPRYRDFSFAPLTAATLPFLIHSLLAARAAGSRGAAEVASAALLGVAVVYIAFNESSANWQSLWLCAALAALAFTLARVRGAPG